jgi:hypothetical protein
MPKSSPAQIAITLEMLSARAKVDWPEQTDNHRAEVSRKALGEARRIHDVLARYLADHDHQLPLELAELIIALGLKLTEMKTALDQEDQTLRLVAHHLYGSENDDGQIKGGIAELLSEVTENLSCTGMLNPEHVDSVRQLDEHFRQDRQTARQRPMLAIANLVPRVKQVTSLARAGNQIVGNALQQALPNDLFSGDGHDDPDADFDLGSEEDWFGEPPTAEGPERPTELGTADFEIVVDAPATAPAALPAAECVAIEEQLRLDPSEYPEACPLPDIIDFPDQEEDFFQQVEIDGPAQGLD